MLKYDCLIVLKIILSAVIRFCELRAFRGTLRTLLIIGNIAFSLFRTSSSIHSLEDYWTTLLEGLC
jgi:hypothetical protein